MRGADDKNGDWLAKGLERFNMLYSVSILKTYAMIYGENKE